MSERLLGSLRKSTAPTQPSGPPDGPHHMAWVTHEFEATVDFYTHVLKMPLVNAVTDDRIPSTGELAPYIHIFFRLGDGSSLAFFAAPGVPRIAPPSHPVYVAFNHVALEVADRTQVQLWRDWLLECGVEVIEHDHGIIHSIYFFDPNGLRLEITTTIDPQWNDRQIEARAAVDLWISTEKEARAKGHDVTEALLALARVPTKPGSVPA